MTVDKAIEELVNLSAQGHGQKKLGTFDHEYGQFMTIVNFDITDEKDWDLDSEKVVWAQASWKGD